MSHTILYSRLFVKMSDGRFLPLIKAGDNNVYDVNPRTGREVRSREWEAWNLRRDKALPACTADDIAAYLERLADDAASHAHGAKSPTANFGWYASLAIEGRGTAGTTLAAFKSFFTQGVRHAVPFGDFVRACGGFKIVWCRKEPGEISCQWKKTEGHDTEEKLRKAWDEAAANANDGGPWLAPMNAWKIDDAAALAHAKAPKTGPATRLHVTLQDGTSGYLKSVYPFTYTDDKDDAMAFSPKALNRVDILRAIPGARSACYDNVKR